MHDLGFYVLLTVFQTYQGVNSWNIYSLKRLQQVSIPGPHDEP